VLTCLNQFTASEIMTGNNKVSCERCTEQHKKSKVLSFNRNHITIVNKLFFVYY